MPQSHLIRVLVVDDHPLLREGVCAVIGTQADLAIIGEAASGEEAVLLYERHHPDIVLMDLQMPGMGGVAAIEALRKDHPGARVIVLTTYSGDAQAMSALRAGAAGYLLKSSMRTELLHTIRSVHAGGKFLSAGIATGIAMHHAEDVLSTRESEVLTLAASGNSNKQIAGRLGLSEDTIKGYMKVIFAKLGAADRTHAVTIAARRGIIEL
ncbi:response regulator transcription factor [Novosphingobium sp. KACC 22771]|uniref:response regulator transcription factor n=1 Tax=Novosphingobium sp. KACC 22771 TaxID=3025670 RepID=UPI0023653DCD|nr:response regulator transcription factor [Novosphingobium sp. KACC 22771]WDF72551.1 response regulator transcription factor [Novosphingobium sp. KACC 22771]